MSTPTASQDKPNQKVEPVVMSADNIQERPAQGFTHVDIGGSVTWKTLLSSPQTATNTFSSGMAHCPPRGGHLNLHRHTHAEMYHITSGHGVVTIDGSEHHVEKGSVLFIPGNAEHGVVNTSEAEDLVWLYVFATDSFDHVVYRFNDHPTKARL